MLSINYTNKCAKAPRCSFCYLKYKKQKEEFNYVQDIPPTQQVAIAYNGINIQGLIKIFWLTEKNSIINITTNPSFLDGNICALFRKHEVKMVALSLDNEKGTIGEWVEKARLLKKAKILVGANILMTEEMFESINKTIKKINKVADQIHFLRPKFYDFKTGKEIRKEMLWLLCQKYKNAFIDQCFKNEFEGAPCTRGIDFACLNPDNSYSLCSFDDETFYSSQLKKLKIKPTPACSFMDKSYIQIKKLKE